MAGFGSHNADLMIVDFSVSAHDDMINTYYSGRSGEILTNMITNVLSLKIEDVYFTHIVKCKPLNSNRPSMSEFDSCKNYLFMQMEFIKPKVIVTLGFDAYAKLCDDDNFEEVRGHVIDFKDYKLIPIYHPQYMMRNPQSKKITLNDLKTIKSCL
jgi:DNA polymerase